jgi:hypothetical protein
MAVTADAKSLIGKGNYISIQNVEDLSIFEKSLVHRVNLHLYTLTSLTLTTATTTTSSSGACGSVVG